jgi:hypothetical protein
MNTSRHFVRQRKRPKKARRAAGSPDPLLERTPRCRPVGAGCAELFLLDQLLEAKDAALPGSVPAARLEWRPAVPGAAVVSQGRDAHGVL